MRVSETLRRRLESSLAHRISRYDVVSASNPLSSSIRFCRAVTSRMYLTRDLTWVSLNDCGRGQSSSSRRHSLIVPLVPPTRIGPPTRSILGGCWRTSPVSGGKNGQRAQNHIGGSLSRDVPSCYRKCEIRVRGGGLVASPPYGEVQIQENLFGQAGTIECIDYRGKGIQQEGKAFNMRAAS